MLTCRETPFIFQVTWSHDILKSKFQIGISFEVILIMNQKFIIVFKCLNFVYICNLLNHYVKQNSRYLEFNFRLKFFLSLWSWARLDSLRLVTFSIYVILSTYFQIFSKTYFASFNKYLDMTSTCLQKGEHKLWNSGTRFSPGIKKKSRFGWN